MAARQSSDSRVTTDHDEIRRWIESKGGRPAHVKSTGRGKDPGVLRVDFPGYSGVDTLEKIPWDQWFAAFDKKKLAFVYQPSARFSKLVSRDAVDAAWLSQAARGRKRATPRRATGAKRATTTRVTAKRGRAKKTTTKTAAKTTARRGATTGRGTPKRATTTKRGATTKRGTAKRGATKRGAGVKRTTKRPATRASSR